LTFYSYQPHTEILDSAWSISARVLHHTGSSHYLIAGVIQRCKTASRTGNKNGNRSGNRNGKNSDEGQRTEDGGRRTEDGGRRGNAQYVAFATQPRIAGVTGYEILPAGQKLSRVALMVKKSLGQQAEKHSPALRSFQNRGIFRTLSYFVLFFETCVV
jgi:hypothetical protein